MQLDTSAKVAAVLRGHLDSRWARRLLPAGEASPPPLSPEQSRLHGAYARRAGGVGASLMTWARGAVHYALSRSSSATHVAFFDMLSGLANVGGLAGSPRSTHGASANGPAA